MAASGQLSGFVITRKARGRGCCQGLLHGPSAPADLRLRGKWYSQGYRGDRLTSADLCLLGVVVVVGNQARVGRSVICPRPHGRQRAWTGLELHPPALLPHPHPAFLLSSTQQAPLLQPCPAVSSCPRGKSAAPETPGCGGSLRPLEVGLSSRAASVGKDTAQREREKNYRGGELQDILWCRQGANHSMGSHREQQVMMWGQSDGRGLSFPLRAGGSQRWLQSGRVVGSDACSSLCVRGGGRGHVLSRAAWVMEGRGEPGRQIGSVLYRDTLLATLPVPPSVSRAGWVLGGTHRGCPQGAPGAQAGRVQTGGCSLVRWCSPGV